MDLLQKANKASRTLQPKSHSRPPKRHVKFEDMIPHTEILKRSNTISIEAQIIKHRLRLTGHVMRMGDDRLPKQAFLSELKLGKRNTGRPLLRYKDQLKRTLDLCKIDKILLETQGTPNPEDPEGLRNA